MFEDSTFESTGRIHTRSRGWMLATFTFNSAILLVLALFPLLYPEALPRMVNSILMTAPPLEQEQPPPPPQRAVPRPSRALEIVEQTVIAPSRIPRTPYVPAVPETPIATTAAAWDSGSQSGRELRAFSRPGNGSSVRPKPEAKPRVSDGVMDGLLIRKDPPEYPPIARAAGIEGTVILQATISKAGTIENLRVVSGPVMLQRAALDAVSKWRYRPYLLNGEPVEVETTVNVRFTLHQ